MTASDLIARLRPRLEQELAELTALRDARVEDRDPVQLDQQSVGRLSRMDAIQGQQMALAADRMRQTRIARLRRALHDMDEGEYGYCSDCGEAIAEARLNVEPTAHLCTACAGSRGV